MAVHTNVVKPRSADVNENLLSETARNKFGLTDEQVKNGQPLENVLEEVIHSFNCYTKPNPLIWHFVEYFIIENLKMSFIWLFNWMHENIISLL